MGRILERIFLSVKFTLHFFNDFSQHLPLPIFAPAPLFPTFALSPHTPSDLHFSLASARFILIFSPFSPLAHSPTLDSSLQIRDTPAFCSSTGDTFTFPHPVKLSHLLQVVPLPSLIFPSFPKHQFHPFLPHFPPFFLDFPFDTHPHHQPLHHTFQATLHPMPPTNVNNLIIQNPHPSNKISRFLKFLP